jgi:hypothetical protein
MLRPPGAVRGFQDGAVVAGATELQRCGQTADTGTQDHHPLTVGAGERRQAHRAALGDIRDQSDRGSGLVQGAGTARGAHHFQEASSGETGCVQTGILSGGSAGISMHDAGQFRLPWRRLY